MIRRTTAFPVLLASALLVSACAGSGDKYPSLAIRDVERNPGATTPAPPVEPVALSIRSYAPDVSIDSLVDQASAAHAAFESRAPAVSASVSGARGSSTDSDAYGRAVVALADLTSYRSQSEIALADLDLMLAERANRLEDTTVIAAAHKLVLDMVNEQDRTLNSLWGRLGQ